MPKKLNINDGQAIDLLLDQSERSRDMSSASYAQPNEGVFHRVASAQKVLSVLDLWEAEEPPVDLIQRTMSRIANSQLGGSMSNENHPRPFGPTA